MDRKQVFAEVGGLLDTYCQDCFLKAHFRKENGKKYALSFCINKCTIGQKLKEYGSNLK